MIPHKARKYTKGKPHHVAVKTHVPGVNFKHPHLIKKITHILNLLSKKPGIALSSYCILSNHIHLIIQFDKDSDLGKLSRDTLFGDAMRMFVSEISRTVNRFYQRKGRLFRDRYWMQALKTGRYILNGFRYVMFNAINHVRYDGLYRLEQDPSSCLYAFNKKLVDLKIMKSTRYSLLRGSDDYYNRSYAEVVNDLAFI